MRLSSNICIVDTVYALSFYLLISDENDIKNTIYFVGNGIPIKIRQRLNKVHYIPTYCQESTIQHLLKAIWIKYKYKTLNTCTFWGQDHIWYFPILVGHKQYNLIEDCPMIFHLHEQAGNYEKVKQYSTKRQKQFFFIKKIRDWIYGPISGLVLGYNQQCKKIILSQPYTLPYVKESQVELFNWKKLWNKSSETKQKLITHIFELTDIPHSGGNILFTQPFVTDKLLTEEEQYTLYNNICKKYSYQNIIIKPHPRDTFDYRKYFPQIPIIEGSIPMQLINLTGIKFEKAITVCSSVVLSFEYDIKIDWIGPAVHPKLLERFGDLKLEDIKNR